MNGKDYIETVNGVSFKMIFVEGGEVVLKYEKQKHKVIVPDFYLAETVVTQELWRAVMGENPFNLKFKNRDKNPVESVSWIDIVEGSYDEPSFLHKLNGYIGLNYFDYKLPSEAMWQFAAQGGNQSNGYEYAGSNHLKEVGWYSNNSHGETKPVKLKLPNELGIYDMTGNVWEWCADVSTIDINDIPQNSLPSEWGSDVKGDFSEVRGGSYLDGHSFCGVTLLNGISNSQARHSNFGFRLSRS